MINLAVDLFPHISYAYLGINDFVDLSFYVVEFGQIIFHVLVKSSG